MNARPTLDKLFGTRAQFPDADARERFEFLVGLDSHKARLAKMVGLLVNPELLDSWAREHHPKAKDLVRLILRRPPLVVLAGDVGTGKTELAETIGDAVARQQNIGVTLLPLSLSTRGQGQVGEMTQLLSAAFEYTIEEARKFQGKVAKARGAVILLVDEADAIAQSRELSQMHHEDRAGVNAFIRGVDQIGKSRVPAAVIMCTNRLGALDPAIKRRAADILKFQRPDNAQRQLVLGGPLRAVGFSEEEILALVTATGPQEGRPYGFSFSDLTQRLLPAIVMDAYPNGPVDPQKALREAESITPTAPFEEATPSGPSLLFVTPEESRR